MPDFFYFLLILDYFVSFLDINPKYIMQSTPNYIIGCSLNWSSYKNHIKFTNDIISSTNYFDHLALFNIVFALDYK